MGIEARAPSDLAGFDPSRPDAEAQLSALVLAVLLVDRSGHVAQANQAAEALLQCGAARLAGKALTDMIEQRDPRVEARLADPDAALVAREIAIGLGGLSVTVDMTVSPVASHPGWRVVTLCEAPEHEIGSDDGIAALAAPSILAHEIKNPLAAIRGAGQLVARKLPIKDKQLGRMVVDEADRIARLVDRMQQLGSASRDEVSPCNPHLAIRSAIATVETARRGGKPIEEEFDPSLPPALANRHTLEQVLINLLTNALDAVAKLPDGRVAIRTRFVSGRALSAMRFGRAVKLPLEIAVIDNGPGIAGDMGDRIFEPFVSSKPSGQGLGLALVRKLVRDMDGSVSYERDERRGLTQFSVRLPLAKSG
ncbi:MAG: ATP-binding protein [Erythrobacter sp.]|uniref:two-component system sensor histidine kinase NtrB n=1 Tax=Erythrobacter sp. TaxID=1042 RepID=UPI003C794021